MSIHFAGWLAMKRDGQTTTIDGRRRPGKKKEAKDQSSLSWSIPTLRLGLVISRRTLITLYRYGFPIAYHRPRPKRQRHTTNGWNHTGSKNHGASGWLNLFLFLTVVGRLMLYDSNLAFKPISGWTQPGWRSNSFHPSSPSMKRGPPHLCGRRKKPDDRKVIKMLEATVIGYEAPDGQRWGTTNITRAKD